MNNQKRNLLAAGTEAESAAETEAEREVQKEKKVEVSNHRDRSNMSKMRWTSIVRLIKIKKSMQKMWLPKYETYS